MMTSSLAFVAFSVQLPALRLLVDGSSPLRRLNGFSVSDLFCGREPEHQISKDAPALRVILELVETSAGGGQHYGVARRRFGGRHAYRLGHGFNTFNPGDSVQGGRHGLSSGAIKDQFFDFLPQWVSER